MGKLTVKGIERKLPAGRYGDGDGLYLVVKESGAKAWVLRVQSGGRRRDIGLGALSLVGLSEARERATELRRHAYYGRDPIQERDRDRKPLPTFQKAATACHAELSKGWGDKTAAAFLSSLSDHVYPKLGNLRIDTIEAWHVRDMLAPIWTTLPETARKVRQRVGAVLTFSQSKGWRAVGDPGKAVTQGLAKREAGGNFAAMPYADVPAFVADLRSKEATNGRNALLFAILTAARSGEVRSARWSQIDLGKGLWNRPAEIMKSRKAHTVTLNRQALALLRTLDAARLIKDDALLFPSKGGASLSDMALTKVLRDAKLSVTAHGFRSSFRDWAAEMMPTIPDPVAEAALAHAVPDKVVAAYKRTEFLEMRRKLLDGWGAFVDGQSNVVRLAAGGKAA